MNGAKTHNVAMLSGGKDSTAMVLRAAESGEFVFDEYIFCDTGREFHGMYDHLNRIEQYLGITITRLKGRHSFEYYFHDYVKTKGDSKGEKGYSWPDNDNRWCTYQLKTYPKDKYLRQFDRVVEFEGIAIDEWSYKKNAHRASNNARWEKRYPLCYWAMTEDECLTYCYDRGFDWDGLYEDFQRVSCYLCPLSSIDELKTLWLKYPEQWAETKALEARGTYRAFRSDYSLVELERRFEAEEERETPLKPIGQMSFDFVRHPARF